LLIASQLSIGTREAVPLVEKNQLPHVWPVNVIDAMEVDDPHLEWKCMNGPKYYWCMATYVPDDMEDDWELCHKCWPRLDEEQDFVNFSQLEPSQRSSYRESDK